MFSPAATPARTRLHGLAPWLPAIVLVTALLVSLVTGRALTRSADAASTVGVQASAPADLYLDAAGCPAAAVNLGELVPGTDPWKTAQDEGGQVCSIDFGTTNNFPGTTLTMLEDPGAPATPTDAMKCVSATCTGSAIADYESAGEPAAGTSAFGAQLLAASGIATGAWNPAPAVYDVQDTASTACTTAAIGTGTCDFTWGATATTSQAAGAYQAQAQLVVLAN